MLIHRRMSLAAVALIAAVVALSAPARAAVLSLYCAWPNNPNADVSLDIDLATGSVAGSLASGRVRIGPDRAAVSDYRITWSDPTGSYTLDRVRGELILCGSGQCNDPQPCSPRNSVTPKF